MFNDFQRTDEEEPVFVTRIGKNCNTPVLAKDIYTNKQDSTEKDLENYTGKCIIWTEFVLNADETVAADNDTIVVQPAGNVKAISHLIKADDIIVIGDRTNERMTVNTVTDSALSIKMDADLSNDYKENEIVKVIWKEADVTIATGKDGATYNRIQYQLAKTDTVRVGRHRVQFKVKDSTGDIEIMYPDVSEPWHLIVFDDIIGQTLDDY